MSVRPARPACVAADESPAAVDGDSVAGLDARRDFERYREPACRRFVAMARAMGHHAFHDLDELAKDFYDDFWLEWMERPRRTFAGSPTAYISGAMMNKLRDLSRRGRSVRAPEIARDDAEAILATVAASDLEPAEQVVLQEEMWLVTEIVHTLPPREQVAFAAVFGRDSKRKDAPPAGYKLAAAKLGVSEVRAKKLSLAANRRIRAAVEKIETGTWCDRWADSIEQVAAGGEGDPAFLAHAEHCVQCRLGVVHLRRQAALLPFPAIIIVEHAGVLSRVWHHVRSAWGTAREQITSLFVRHAPVAGDTSGIATASGGAAGVGATAIKLTAVCLGVGLAGGGVSACLTAAGVPNPVIAAIAGSAHHARPRRPHPRHETSTSTATRVPISMTSSTVSWAPAIPPPRRPTHATKPRPQSPAKRAIAEAQAEFAPGGGSGVQGSTTGSGSQTVHDARASIDAATLADGTSATDVKASPSSTSKPQSKSASSGGTVTTGSSNDFSAP